MTRKRLLFLIILLVIGFATVSTTLVLNGVTLIGSNEQDFQIFFSEAILDDADKSNSIIKDNKQIIDFETNELSLVGDVSTLDYEVTNNSRQYDAEVEINCVAKSPEILDYVDLEYSIEKEIIPAKERTRGKVKATLKKPYTGDEEFDKTLACSIETNALEKENANDIVLEEREHYAYGYLTKYGDSLPNRVVAVIANGETKMSTTDIRGMFIIEGLVGGDYELLVIEGKTEEELGTLTHEELKTLASDSSAFNTADGKLTLTNYEISNSKINPGSPTTHTITFDTSGGTTGTFTGTLIEGEPIGHLPKEVEHETLAFVDWQENGTTVSEDKVYNGDITLNANYGDGVAKIGEKQFRTLNNAFNYINNKDETTIDVIKANSIQKDITTDKNVILNLNEFKVDFNTHKLTNSGTLTIKNGMIDASGEYVLENNGTLNITDNTTINHNNNTNETTVISTITNNESSTMNIVSSSVNTSYASYVQDQAMITNYGIITIDNSNMDSSNGSIYIEESGTLNINNSNLEFENCIENDRFIKDKGTLNYTDSNIKIKESNTVSLGIIHVSTDATANIISGVLDNTYGKGNAIYTYEGSTLKIGEEGKEVNNIGNNSNSYTVCTYGNFNIPSGTINTSNGFGYGIFGKINIGSETEIPTLNHNDSRNMIDIRSNEDNRVINANINSTDGMPIDVFSGANMTIDEANITYKSTIQYKRIIISDGNLTINGGNYKFSEENTGGAGLLQVNSPGTATINGGYFDNTYGEGNSIYAKEGTTLTIGSEDTLTTLIGNGENTATLYAGGSLFIPTGTIDISNGSGMLVGGKVTVGSETTTPTINGNIGKQAMFGINSSKENRIVSANINSNDAWSIYVYENAKLIVDDIDLKQTSANSTSRSISVAGELIINNGNFKIVESNTKSNGLLTINSTGKVTINGGTFDNTYGKSNSIYTNAGSTLNMGAEGKKVNVIGNDSNSYIVCAYGNINIPAGTIDFSKGYSVVSYGLLTIGSETTTPTIVGNTGKKTILTIRSNKENIIKNANIKVNDARAINIYENMKLTINNVNLEQTNSTVTYRAIQIGGELIVNGGRYAIADTNTTGFGLLEILSKGTVTINGGTFDNTYGKSNSIYADVDSTLNIGKEDKIVELIGNSKNYPSAYSKGILNIPTGTINTSNGGGYAAYGKLTIGSETSTPTLNNTSSETLLTIHSNEDNKIVNCTIRSNAVEEKSRLIGVHGTLTIDNADVVESGKYLGIFSMRSNSKTTINGGSYVYSPEGTGSNAIFIEENAVVDLGKDTKVDLSITNTTSASNFPLITNHGELNIYSGNYRHDTSDVIIQLITNENNETAEEKLNYAATTNIYGGHLENNSKDKATFHMSAGKLNMSAGEIINNGGGRTIYNNGGTAIQTGGTSANNYGVTVQQP